MAIKDKATAKTIRMIRFKDNSPIDTPCCRWLKVSNSQNWGRKCAICCIVAGIKASGNIHPASRLVGIRIIFCIPLAVEELLENATMARDRLIATRANNTSIKNILQYGMPGST